jgi:hypothetical protein
LTDGHGAEVEARRADVDHQRLHRAGSVPLTATAIVPAIGSLLAIVMMPVCVPATVGEPDCYGLERTGADDEGVASVAEKRAFELAMEFTVSVALPVVRTVSVRSFVWPTFTLPNSRLDGVTEMEGGRRLAGDMEGSPPGLIRRRIAPPRAADYPPAAEPQAGH